MPTDKSFDLIDALAHILIGAFVLLLLIQMVYTPEQKNPKITSSTDSNSILSILSILYRDAPETLREPLKEEFTNEQDYEEAMLRFRICGSWATDENGRQEYCPYAKN